MKVYPIKFHPILKERIWGGNKLASLLGKESNKNNIGVSWEISNVNGHIFQISNGAYEGSNLDELISFHNESFLGTLNF